METGAQLKVSSDRLVKPGIKAAAPGLQGKQFIHYTMVTPDNTQFLYNAMFGIHRNGPCYKLVNHVKKGQFYNYRNYRKMTILW